MARPPRWKQRLRRTWMMALKYIILPAVAALLALVVWSVLSS
jgi:hypothetical protein